MQIPWSMTHVDTLGYDTQILWSMTHEEKLGYDTQIHWNMTHAGTLYYDTRTHLQHVGSLCECLLNEVPALLVQLQERILQVSNASMNQLRGPSGRSVNYFRFVCAPPRNPPPNPVQTSPDDECQLTVDYQSVHYVKEVHECTCAQISANCFSVWT